MFIIIKNIFTKEFIKKLLIKWLLGTIPGKLVSSGIFMLTGGNVILLIILFIIKDKYGFNFTFIEKTPSYLGFILIFIGFIWYFIDKIINNFNNKNIPIYGTFENEYQKLMNNGSGKIETKEDEVRIKKENKDEIEKILNENLYQINEIKLLLNNDHCKVIQIIHDDNIYLHKFIIGVCNIEGDKIHGRIIDNKQHIKKLIEYDETFCVYLANIDYSYDMGYILSKNNTLVIKTTKVLKNIVNKVFLEKTKEIPEEFINKLYTN